MPGSCTQISLSELPLVTSDFQRYFQPLFPSKTQSNIFHILFVFLSNVNNKSTNQRHRRGSVVALDSDKWPNGRIPYVLSSEYCKFSKISILKFSFQPLNNAQFWPEQSPRTMQRLALGYHYFEFGFISLLYLIALFGFNWENFRFVPKLPADKDYVVISKLDG